MCDECLSLFFPTDSDDSLCYDITGFLCDGVGHVVKINSQPTQLDHRVSACSPHEHQASIGKESTLVTGAEHPRPAFGLVGRISKWVLHEPSRVEIMQVQVSYCHA
jgi:hypothetical protein